VNIITAIKLNKICNDGCDEIDSVEGKKIMAAREI